MGILDWFKAKIGYEKKVIEESQRIVDIPINACKLDVKTGKTYCRTRNKLIIVDKTGRKKVISLE